MADHDDGPDVAASRAPGFFDPVQFGSSSLYAALCPVVAGNDLLRALALEAQPGQRPEFLFFGAVHQLLLSGIEHGLARFYPSIVGDDAEAPEDAGPALESFCRLHREELSRIISARLVQTNHVRRAVGLRTALAWIAPQVAGEVDLVEVGASTGLLLNFDRYGYRLHHRGSGAEHSFGDLTSPVQLHCDILGEQPTPDLDALPPVVSTVGVDLHPVDPKDPAERAWLRALVWPEDHEQRALLTAALEMAAQAPPRILAGDIIDSVANLKQMLSRTRTRVAFHCATRIHVPQRRLAGFDAAIRALGEDGPLWEIAIEYPPEPDPRPFAMPTSGVALVITDPAGRSRTIATVHGHLQWLAMRSEPDRRRQATP